MNPQTSLAIHLDITTNCMGFGNERNDATLIPCPLADQGDIINKALRVLVSKCRASGKILIYTENTRIYKIYFIFHLIFREINLILFN